MRDVYDYRLERATEGAEATPLVSVLVPYSPAGPEREKAWAWNEQRIRALLPEAELVTAAPDLTGDPGRFCRALALNRAAAKATGDTLVIFDADTTCAPESLGMALLLAESGLWTLPLRYVRLNAEVSARWLAGPPLSAPPPDWDDAPEQEYPAANSGVVVMPRVCFDAAGGFDLAFDGWGGEDDGFRCAAETLYRRPQRLGVCYHLWHPRPAEHHVGSPGQAARRALSDRYGNASGHPNAMRRLLRERD